MGLISGFISGTGKGMAQAGQMLFADKIAKEREESNFLRDSALKKTMAVEEREFKSSEAEKRDVAAMERTKYTSDTKAAAEKAKGAGSTSQIKNMKYLMTEAGGKKSLNEAVMLAFPGAKIKATDKEGNISVAIPIGGDKFENIGKFTHDEKGNQVWLNKGEELENAPIESSHRKQVKKEADEKDKLWGGEKDPFSETGGDRDAWIKMRRQQVANEDRAAKKRGATTETPKAGGIIGDKMPKAPTKRTAPQKAVDAVMADKKLLPQFIEHYGYDPTKQ
jgi:Rieske Fe-S protein